MTTIADLTPSVVKLLGNRSDVAARVPEHMSETILELSDNYPFEELRVTGPTVQFVPGQNAYSPSFFQPAAVNGNPFAINKIISWFMYLQPPLNLSSGLQTGAANSGYNLKFKDMEELETLANVLSIPQFWSQLGADLYVVATPLQPYYSYIRFSWLHPFTASGAVSTDPIYMPATWFDIIKIGTAERIALDLRMQDVADRMHTKLFGDPEFQRSSGGRGQPGLIARRISQTQKNQSRTTRSVQVVRSVY